MSGLLKRHSISSFEEKVKMKRRNGAAFHLNGWPQPPNGPITLIFLLSLHLHPHSPPRLTLPYANGGSSSPKNAAPLVQDLTDLTEAHQRAVLLLKQTIQLQGSDCRFSPCCPLLWESCLASTLSLKTLRYTAM